MLYRCVLQSGKSGDGYELSSTLCKYDLRKGYFLFGVGQGCDECGGEVSIQS